MDTSPTALQLLRDIVAEIGELASLVTIVDARTEQAEDVRLSVFGAPEPGLVSEKGANAVLILPEAQVAFDYGLALLRSHSTCVCVSFPVEGFRFNPRDLVFRHIKITGVLVGRNRQLRAMLEFAAKEGVRARIATYKLEDLNVLVEDYHKGASGKLVIDMQLR